jgi:hypothetical protein
MKKMFKNILLTIIAVLMIYGVFFIISLIPATLFSPVFIYELIKDPSSWQEVSVYYKIIIILGFFIFLSIIIFEIIRLIKFIKGKLNN